jgi:hypothetical protein
MKANNKGGVYLKAKKSMNEQQFNSLTNQQQTAELKRMAKRANVRLSLLEEKGIIDTDYYKAKMYNADNGKLKNRFYEGTKYKDADETKQAYSALSELLGAEKSTLGGVQHAIQKTVDQLTEHGNFDYKALSGLSKQEKIYASKAISKTANKELKDLEKADINKFAYQVAGQYNEATGRDKNRFYTGGKFKSEKDIDIHLQNVQAFIQSETATPRGYIEVIKNRLNTFRGKGLNIEDRDEQKFLDFLSSQQFATLKQYADSNQIIETFTQARDLGTDVKKIQDEFNNYINSDIGFDEVQEKLKVAKWNNGGLLH